MARSFQDPSERPEPENRTADVSADRTQQAAAQRLSEHDALEVTRRMAELGQGGIPLTEGMAAVADELGSGRLARTFRTIARDGDRGLPLERILQQRESQFPRHIVGLVRAARRTGQLEQALTELIEQHCRMRDLSRAVRASMAYPLMVLTVAIALVLLLQVLLAGHLADLSDTGWGVELPYVTQWMIWWTDGGAAWVGGTLLLLVLGLLLLRLVVGASAWQRMRATVPLFGPLWHWSGVAQWTRLLGLLVQYRVPLPEALRLAADGSRDANVAQVSRRLADGAEQGRQLSEMLAGTYRLPASLVPLLRWGEQSSALDEALRSSSEMLEGRVLLRANLLRVILPPLALLLIAVAVGLLVAALLLPMVQLLDLVSGLM